MCNIAGYVGNKHAAPILIRMLKREELFDGYMSTGITTASNGELLFAKTVGNTDTLVKESGCDSFDGCVGFVHSRSSAIGGIKFAQPFIDENRNCSLCSNGIFRDIKVNGAKEISKMLYEKGYNFSSAQLIDKRIYTNLPNGKTVSNSDIKAVYTQYLIENGYSIAEALAKCSEALVCDHVNVMMHKNTPDRIYVCRITRPMMAAVCEDETYIATTRFAFPEDITPKEIISLPLGTVCEILAGEVKITPYKVNNVGLEDVTEEMFKTAYKRVSAFLEGRENNPCHFDIIEDELYRNWRDIWHKPYVDTALEASDGLLKPYAHLLYEVLYKLYTEGKLKRTVGTPKGRDRYLFWI